ncbi:hypothetical protein HanRHA438_Chr06g0255221 [Helianthus annuus]|nr:hypothetical protein HanHA300_Chr06g0201911 [Helianthus annuus]KAJ0565603.1 hypothetical protein HanIR_Chr06g0264441 [Helianthus annuus]KAJ0572554.1 hypothetical protein HanHA89_Chr06g0217001 [Helianthus annuus]KAJ0910705.1 hypothetical protein HanRHA438_Chr06g0255221 [Helianthus annuus]
MKINNRERKKTTTERERERERERKRDDGGCCFRRHLLPATESADGGEFRFSVGPF